MTNDWSDIALRYSKEMQLGRSYREVRKPDRSGRRRTFVIGECESCNDHYERRKDGKVHLNLCSSCASIKANQGRKGRIIEKARTGKRVTCKQCNREFYVNKYRLQNGSVKFCTITCSSDWRKENGVVPKNFISSPNNSGKNNGRYKHGNYIGNHVNKRKLRELVIDRDGGNWCLFCGTPGPGLHLHRVVYGSQGGRYELDNCVQLCAAHHETVHSSKKKWMPILLDHIENGTLRKGAGGI